MTALDWSALPAFVSVSAPLRAYMGFLASWLASGHTSAVPGCGQVLAELLAVPDAAGSSDRRIERVRDWMEVHYAEPVTLAQLAALACLSVRQFSERFRQACGQSPQQYLRGVRLQRAQALLQQTDLSLQQVSDAVGYTSLSAFSQRFREHWGVSPGHYRRNGRK